MTLEDLRLLIERYSKRTDLRNGGFIDQLIELTAIHIGRDARMMELDRVSTLTVIDKIGLPDDYMAMRGVSISTPRGQKTLRAVSVADFDKPYDRVEVYLIKNGQINIHGQADITLSYGIRPEPLVADSDTNFVLEQYSTVYLYGTLREVWSSALDAEAYEHALMRYTEEVDSINAHYDRQLFGNTGQITRVDK